MEIWAFGDSIQEQTTLISLGYIAFYARQLCIASHCLSPLIRQSSGDAPSTWIIKAVISEAKVLLKQSDKTVLQISEELGFPNSPFFCRYFKRETGMTPSEYREG